jgi:hypothetical protein
LYYSIHQVFKIYILSFNKRIDNECSSLEFHYFQVYADLLGADFPNITIYKKESIPDIYHLKTHRRTAPIIIEADNGVAIVAPWKCDGCAVGNK